jgi:hypothetical protein
MPHNRPVTSQLSAVPIERRRQLSATIGLFAVLFFAVGAVAWTGPPTLGMRVFVGLAFLVSLLLALIAWGVLTSVRRDLAEQRLDAAIAETLAAKGALSCGCGHEHDPAEMHVSDASADGRASADCAHDGAGAGCAHDCETCVLSAMRERPRPGPRPLPR